MCNFYNSIREALLTAGDTTRSVGNYEQIPGWNDLVEEHHREAREHYLFWRENGKPRFGQIYWDMTRSRLQFKRALKQCRKQKEAIIDRKIAEKLKGNYAKSLWGDINKKKNIKIQLSETIDNANGGDAICAFWKNRYEIIFNDTSHPAVNQYQHNTIIV